MKNLIDPKILADFKRQPITNERIAVFLEQNKNISTAQFCKLLQVDAQQFYNWKNRMKKSSVSKEGIDVTPTGIGRKSYSANDKLKLIKQYGSLDGEKRTEFLRRYGLYDSDFTRWQEKADGAALEALSTRKIRSDKKSSEQLEIERLKAELRGQEKTIAKLSALVVAQKKISELLNSSDALD